jgi:hypothetical protein
MIFIKFFFTLADKQLLSQPGRVENSRSADLDPAGFGTFGSSDPDPKISQR